MAGHSRPGDLIVATKKKEPPPENERPQEETVGKHSQAKKKEGSRGKGQLDQEGERDRGGHPVPGRWTGITSGGSGSHGEKKVED